MKLALLSILICTSSVFSTETKSQTAKVTISVTNTEIFKIIDEIEDQTDYLFIYNAEKVDLNKKCSIDAQSETVAEVLTNVFSDSDIFYAMEGTNIMLMKKEKAANVISQTRQEQSSIKGTVVDSKGETIVGATIQLKGTTTGVVTDIDGAFSIKAEASDILIVSFIGYLTEEVTIGSNKVLSIQLEEDVEALDEVVIVGYGTAKKSSLTGAITSLDAERMDNIPISNISNALAGRAPGVNVSNVSGFAGASASIRIRGSFAEPLYVINNIIRSKEDFDALDMNEVANISFLKDAASASIFGSKAGNGVVVVTTRAGKKNQKPTFSYKGSYSTSGTTREIDGWTATDELDWSNARQGYLGQPDIHGPETYAYFADKTYAVNDYVWQNPSAWTHNLSVTGGGEKIQYFMSVGFQDQEGSYKNVEFDKFNFRSDVTAQITERFKVNVNLSGNQREYDRFYWPFDDYDNMELPDFYRTTFNWTRLYPFYAEMDGTPTHNTNANPVAQGSWNPVDMVMGDRYQRVTDRTFDGQIKFTLDLGEYVPGLEASALVQYTAKDIELKRFLTHNTSYRFQPLSPSQPLVSGPLNPEYMTTHNLGQAYESVSNNMTLSNSHQLNWFLNYNRTFGKHGVSGMLVYEQAGSHSSNLSGKREDLMAPIDQFFVTSGDALRSQVGGSEAETARQSLIGRFNYNFDEKYIAEFSFRYDGNYKFAPGENWGFFPSVSAAWRITEEDFMKNVGWLSSLKLRSSFGTSGADSDINDNDISAFQWRDKFKGGSSYLFGNGVNNGLSSGNTPNPLISWSTYKVFDIGFDFALLDNRLAGDFDYFYKNKSDILGKRQFSTPYEYGATLPAENYAEQEWRGVEFSLNWRDRIGEVNYSVNANIGYTADQWVVFDEAEGLEEWRSKIGQPKDRLYGYVSEGLIRTQEQLDAIDPNFTQFGRKPEIGSILYKDIRGTGYSEGADGNIDANDQTYISDNGIARINYGFGFTVEWKGISLDAHFQGVGAFDKMVGSGKQGHGVFQVSDRPYFPLWANGDTWSADNIGAKYPRASGEWKEEYGAAGSTFWMESGAYLRLKNLNIGYALPKRWLAKTGLGGVQLYVNGTNLFCISGFDLYDPEQAYVDSYPLMKSFTGGLSINF